LILSCCLSKGSIFSFDFILLLPPEIVLDDVAIYAYCDYKVPSKPDVHAPMPLAQRGEFFTQTLRTLDLEDLHHV